MPTTPVYGLPWPLSTATPDVPRDLQALAEGTETGLRRHGSWAIGTASLTAQPTGQVAVNLTGITQAGGFSLSAGQIQVPYDGRYLIIDGAEWKTFHLQMWVGDASATNLNGINLNGATAQWQGQYMRLVTVSAGATVSRTNVYANVGPFDVDVAQTVIWLGEPV